MERILTKISEFLAYLYNKENWKVLLEAFQTNPIFKWLMLIGVFCLLLLLRRFFYRKHPHLLRVYMTKQGLVFLKESALKGAIKKICREIVPQAKARVKIYTCFRKIKIRVSIVCPRNVQVIGIQLQQTIIYILREKVGISNLYSVHVVIERIIGPMNAKEFDDTFTIHSKNISSFSDNNFAKNAISYEKCDCSNREKSWNSDQNVDFKNEKNRIED